MTNRQLLIAYLFALLTVAGLFLAYWSLAVAPGIQGGIYFVLVCVTAFLIAPFPGHYYSFPADRAPLITHILSTPVVWACFLFFISILLKHDLSFWVSMISFIGVVVASIILHAFFPGTPSMKEAIAAKKVQKVEAEQEEQIAAHEAEALLIPIKIPNQALDVADLLSEVVTDVMVDTLRPATLAIGKKKLAVTVNSGLERAREVVGLTLASIRAIHDTGHEAGAGAHSIVPLVSGAAFGLGLSLAIYFNSVKEAAVRSTGSIIVMFGFITVVFSFGFWIWSRMRADHALGRIATIRTERGDVLWFVVNDESLEQLERFAADSSISFAKNSDG